MKTENRLEQIFWRKENLYEDSNGRFIKNPAYLGKAHLKVDEQDITSMSLPNKLSGCNAYSLDCKITSLDEREYEYSFSLWKI